MKTEPIWPFCGCQTVSCIW